MFSDVKYFILLNNLIYQLAVEWGVGIAVLIRCFTDKRETESQITDRLGDGFSRAPFATIVVCINVLYPIWLYLENSDSN